MRVKRATQLILVMILALTVAATVYPVLRTRRQKVERYRQAYGELTIGDSRDAVVALMGQPLRVTNCENSSFANPKERSEFRSKCFQEYEYVELMARYTFSFDRSGMLINKSEAVSP